jgi:hypothetical protein
VAAFVFVKLALQAFLVGMSDWLELRFPACVRIAQLAIVKVFQGAVR